MLRRKSLRRRTRSRGFVDAAADGPVIRSDQDVTAAANRLVEWVAASDRPLVVAPGSAAELAVFNRAADLLGRTPVIHALSDCSAESFGPRGRLRKLIEDCDPEVWFTEATRERHRPELFDLHDRPGLADPWPAVGNTTPPRASAVLQLLGPAHPAALAAVADDSIKLISTPDLRSFVLDPTAALKAVANSRKLTIHIGAELLPVLVEALCDPSAPVKSVRLVVYAGTSPLAATSHHLRRLSAIAGRDLPVDLVDEPAPRASLAAPEHENLLCYETRLRSLPGIEHEQAFVVPRTTAAALVVLVIDGSLPATRWNTERLAQAEADAIGVDVTICSITEEALRTADGGVIPIDRLDDRYTAGLLTPHLLGDHDFSRPGVDINALWCAVLGETSVDPTVAFSDLGGRSLDLLVMLTAIEAGYGIAVSGEDFEGISTLERLIDRVVEHRRSATDVEPQTSTQASMAGVVVDTERVVSTWSLARTRPSSLTFAATGPRRLGHPVLVWFAQDEFELRTLAAEIGETTDLIGLRSLAMTDWGGRRLTTDERYTPENVDAILDRCVPDLLDALADSETVAAGGNCQGGILASQLAPRLDAAGHPVDRLVLVDFGFSVPATDLDVHALYGIDSRFRAHADSNEFRASFPNATVTRGPFRHGEFFRPGFAEWTGDYIRGALGTGSGETGAAS